MDGRPLRVLMVEDDDDDFVLTRELLAEADGAYTLERAADPASALAALTGGGYDVALVDYRLGEQSGLDLLREAVRRGVRAPVILLTGVGDHAVDLEAMRAGAADYLVKDGLNAQTLERTLRYAVERRRTADALRSAHEELERRVAERTAELSAAN